MYMYACLFRQKRPTINHAKFFAQFIRVADTKYEIRFFANESSELPLNARVIRREGGPRGGV